jgi:hypothetical protein
MRTITGRGAAVLLAVALAALPSASVAQEPEPTPVPTARAGAIDFASRGVHCLECYVLWDPNANAQALLGSPPEVTGPAWLATELPAAGGGTCGWRTSPGARSCWS